MRDHLEYQQSQNRKQITNGMFIVFIILILSNFLTGCAGTIITPTKSYRPPQMTFEANKHTLFRAVVLVVNQQGWSIVKLDQSKGIVEALTPLDEYEIRNRWFFKVENNSITAARRIEKLMNIETTDQWFLEERVCVGYGYAREKILLTEIRTELSESPTISVAALETTL